MTPELSRRLGRAVNLQWTSFDERSELIRMAEKLPSDATFQDLPKQWQDWVLEREKGAGL